MSVETLAVVASAQAAATAHQQAQRAITATSQASVAALWETLRMAQLWTTWLPLLTKAATSIAAGQALAASTSPDYVRDALALAGIESEEFKIKPTAFAGLTSDGRTLEGLLSQAPVVVRRSLAAGRTDAQALADGGRFLRSVTATQIVDAQDLADQVSLVGALTPADGTPYRSKRRGVTSTVGWVRVLNPPSCGRCAVLAGSFYRWSDGFQRHFGCDCEHYPAPEAIAGEIETDPAKYFDSLSEEDQAKYFGKANSEAIRAGADIGAVMRASTREGALYKAGGVKYTKEGTSKRGFYAKRAAELGFSEKRRTPLQIMQDTKGDIEAARRELYKFGYIL